MDSIVFPAVLASVNSCQNQFLKSAESHCYRNQLFATASSGVNVGRRFEWTVARSTEGSKSTSTEMLGKPILVLVYNKATSILVRSTDGGEGYLGSSYGTKFPCLVS